MRSVALALALLLLSASALAQEGPPLFEGPTLQFAVGATPDGGDAETLDGLDSTAFCLLAGCTVTGDFEVEGFTTLAGLEVTESVSLGDDATDQITIDAGEMVTTSAFEWGTLGDVDILCFGGVDGFAIDGTTLSVDCLNNRVGVGTSSPGSGALHVVGNMRLETGDLDLYRTDTHAKMTIDARTAGFEAAIGFYGDDGAVGQYTISRDSVDDLLHITGASGTVSAAGGTIVTFSQSGLAAFAGDVTIAGTLNGRSVSGLVDGTGSANRVAYWSDADTLTNSANLTFDGTTLTVAGTIAAPGDLIADSVTDLYLRPRDLYIEMSGAGNLIVGAAGADTGLVKFLNSSGLAYGIVFDTTVAGGATTDGRVRGGGVDAGSIRFKGTYVVTGSSGAVADGSATWCAGESITSAAASADLLCVDGNGDFYDPNDTVVAIDDGVTMTGPLTVQSSGSAFGSTTENVINSRVANTGSAEVAFDLRPPAGYTSADYILILNSAATSTPIYSFKADGSNFLFGSTTTNVGTSNVANTGGVDTAWRINSNGSDATDVVVNFDGLWQIKENGDAAIGGTTSAVITSNITATGSQDTFFKFAATGDSGSPNDYIANFDDKVFIMGNNAIGIGATPGELFEITASGAGSRGANVINVTTTGSSKYAMTAATNSSGLLSTFGSGSVGVSYFGTANDGFTALVAYNTGTTGLKLGTLTSDPIIIGTNDVERAEFAATTGVVFNEPQNDYDFTVASDTLATALFVDGGTGSVGVNTGSPSAYAGYGVLSINGSTGGVLEFMNDGAIEASINNDATDGMVFSATGIPGFSFGIDGTTLPLLMTATLVTFNDNENDMDVAIHGDNDVALGYFDAGADRFGVGDATPDAKLDVNGTINVANFMVSEAPQAVTIADDGAGTSPTSTTEPTVWQVEVTCNDANGCNYNPADGSVADGTQLVIINVSANTVTVNDTAGSVVVSGAANIALAQDESIRCSHTGTLWSCR